MKAVGILIMVFASFALVFYIGYGVVIDYQYENQIGSYWSLSVKASTLEAKSGYLDVFVKNIDAQQLDGYNALFLKTPDNSAGQNLSVLHTLQKRMEEIKMMNPTSFEYNQAIQQITAQEQDEAKDMLDNLKECWFMKYHFFYWGWLCLPIFFTLCFVIFVGWIVYAADK